MKICPNCGMKFIRNDYYEKHLNTHPAVETKVEAPVVETAVVSLAPTPAPVTFQASTEEVTLNFRKPIEVYINGKPFVGKQITFANITIASEVVRIAREAYGRDILV